jgi:TPP-dependent pyruvate/acetoin dehydrogenase alpha subunit
MSKEKMFLERYGLTKDISLWLLEKMLEIRLFQERIIKIYPTDVLVTPVHLHIGEEAVPVGVCAHLKATDTIFFGHRTHGPALAKGMDMKILMAELYGRTTGCSHSYGGSMHVIDPSHGMLGSSSIVGGNISLGVGSALASKLRNADYISLSYFGDGATDTGVFWEAINFAALKKVPVLFVCEDNNLSNVMPKTDHMFLSSLLPVTEQFMTSFQADGTDVLSVYTTAEKAIKYVRENRKPAFLECKTKRWMKHQGIEKDDLPYNPIDLQKDCPIRKFEDALIQHEIIKQQELQSILNMLEARIDEAIEFSVNSPFPNEEELLKEA